MAYVSLRFGQWQRRAVHLDLARFGDQLDEPQSFMDSVSVGQVITDMVM